jgi:predicted phage terminase large subunit-like protein
MDLQTLPTATRVELARQTPAGLAWVLSNGLWRSARHLTLLNTKLLDLAAGRIRRLAVFMPPRHGKSQLCSRYFPAWFLGTFPDSRVIQAGYGNAFAATWGRHTRNAIDEANRQGIFPVQVDPAKSSADEWEILGHEGGMKCVGWGGGVTGYGADLLTVDDPTKSRAEAESLTYRDRVWDWYTDDLYTRLHPGARVLLVATRWHSDDLPGRILAQDAERHEWTIINLPALAEENDALGRAPGEALWPERYDLAALQDAQTTLGSYGFAALYQQRPAPREGGMFRREWFRIQRVRPERVLHRCRFWDLAGTEGGGDYTAGALVAHAADGLYYVEDVRHEQLSPRGVRDLVLQTAALDGPEVEILIEQEPGSSGVAVVAEYQRLLAGYPVRGVRATGSKELRADPLAAQFEAGNVVLIEGPWNAAYIEELCSFGSGCAHDDQVDASSGSFNRLAELSRGIGTGAAFGALERDA